MVKSKILPIPCLDILVKKFSGNFNDSLFEDALEGRNCHIRLPDYELATLDHFVNSATLNIPTDDYIASLEVAEILDQFFDYVLDEVHFQWPNGQHLANSLVYDLMTELTFKSKCNQIDCRVFRSLVQQTHYQLTLMLKTGKGRNKFDVLFPMEIVAAVAKSLNKTIEQSFQVSPQIRPRRSWWCGISCFRYPATTTTVIPSNLARIEWNERHVQRISVFFKTHGEEKLDDILLSLNHISQIKNIREQLKLMHSVILPDMIGLTKCVSTRPLNVIRETTVNLTSLVFGILGAVQGAQSNDDLIRILEMSRDSILIFRYIFQFL